MKRKIAALLILVGLISTSAKAGLVNNNKTVLALQIGNSHFAINTRVTKIDEQSPTLTPLEQIGSPDNPFVPLQALLKGFSDMGDSVFVLSNAKEVIVSKGATNTIIGMNKLKAKKIKGNMYIPLSTLREQFGLSAVYDMSSKIILVGFGEITKFDYILDSQPAYALLEMTNPQAKYMDLYMPQSTYSLFEMGPAVGMQDRDRISYKRIPNNIELYPVAEDAKPKDGIAKGKLTTGKFTSKVNYPGVSYDYTVYVPAQYDAKSPANFIVFLDGGFFQNAERMVNATVVLDNLIAKGEIPVTIALFIDAGSPGPGLPIYGGKGNRSIEYDAVDDLYAKFLIDELMPQTVGSYNLSVEPAKNCILGVSSSANAAFAVAWYRNDRFGSVVSISGSFVNIRGGNIWPFAIRKSETKKIKTFLTVGELDLNILFGDWLTANYDMARALEYRGYEYMLVEHKSGHNGAVMHYMLPDVLKWMWNDVKFTPENCIVTSSESKSNLPFGR